MKSTIENNNMVAYLYPTRAVYSVLGNICKNPRALKDTEIHLELEDFLQEFHKIVFSAINNIVYSGEEVNHITEIDIDNHLALHSTLYKIWEDSQGLDFVREAIEHSNIETFKYNYNLLKKYTLLRDYVNNGIDISDIYDYASIDLKAQSEGKSRIDKMTLEEIVEHYTLKMNKLKNKWNISKNSKSFKAGDNLRSLLPELHAEPEFGYPFANTFYNAIFRGMRPGKFMLRSATTGGGKTRQSMADMCHISCDELYNIEKKQWESTNESKPTLFISTELEQRELQTLMLAYITGVSENKIKAGGFDSETYAILERGIDVLERAPIYCVYVDDFSISEIEGIIEQYILEKDVEYVAFDYIQITAKLARTMTSAFGMGLREDQILVQFSSAMKLLANKYDIYIISSTQLNRNNKEYENRDTQSLRGGSSTADKVDHGVMSFKATAKDHENLKHILETTNKKPNFSHWVYKNRSGANGVIIWTIMDMGTMREEPLFVTDTDFNIVEDIQKHLVTMTKEKQYDTGFGNVRQPEINLSDTKQPEINFNVEVQEEFDMNF